ncbi:MAG: iron chelate uptake ABC transporter family permease subunit, partial [Oscillospiraceae bacterium]|nr:iron chelate uptake ABC transporter family permease subunit [Oscillospiraceae bacterium]
MKFLRNFFQSKKTVFTVSILVLLLAIVISLCVGVVMYTPAQLLQLPNILRYIRFPRVMAAVFAGAGLAGAGVIIQTLLGNSLAGPNIIGVNSGAGFMTLIAALVFPLIPQMQPLAAFLGALFSVMMIYLLSRRAGTSKMTILLSGVVLNALLNAASEALCTFFPDIHMSYAAFRVGGLSTVQTSVLYPAA